MEDNNKIIHISLNNKHNNDDYLDISVDSAFSCLLYYSSCICDMRDYDNTISLLDKLKNAIEDNQTYIHLYDEENDLAYCILKGLEFKVKSKLCEVITFVNYE